MTPASTPATRGTAGLSTTDKASALTKFYTDAGIPWADEQDDDAASLDSSLEIALRIAQAETPAEVLNPASTLNGQEIIGQPFVVNALRLARSTYAQGLPFYMQMDVTFTDTGERQMVSCGSLNVMTQLAKLGQLGALERPVVVVESENPTARGYRPLWLKSAAEVEAEAG